MAQKRSQLSSLALVVALTSTFALACSSGGGGDDPLDADYAPNFTGVWFGTLTITVAGETLPSSVYLPIEATGENRLVLREMCPDGGDAQAVVTSPSTFRMNAVTCAPSAVTGCAAVTLQYTQRTATLTSGTLELPVAGTMSGCGQRFSFTGQFIGTLEPAPAMVGLSGTARPVGAAAVEVPVDGGW